MNTCNDIEIEEISKKLKVIGHPVRLKLLCIIEKNEEPCVTHLWTCLNQAQPVVSQHLAVLKESGIVSSEIQGTKRVYSIIDPFIKIMIKDIIKNIQK